MSHVNRSPEDEQLYKIRHGAAHVMAQAVLEMHPEAVQPRPSARLPR